MARSATSDPLEKFRFSVSFDGDTEAEGTTLTRIGFHDVQTPKRSTSKGTYREGHFSDVSQLFAGLSTFEDITLSRGVLAQATDENNALYKWMSAVHKPGVSSTTVAGSTIVRSTDAAANKYRKDIRIIVYDREGIASRTWKLHNAFPVNFVPGSDLDASEDGDKMLESLTLAYEDFEELQSSSSKPVDVSVSIP